MGGDSNPVDLFASHTCIAQVVGHTNSGVFTYNQ